jgi:hypothetical protein
MEVTQSVLNADGRAPGSWVYVFLCENEGKAILKIGVSDNPARRFQMIRTGCPFRHINSVMVNVYTRDVAFEIERVLLEEFKPWRTNGEWLSFDYEEKPVFNHRFRAVLDRYKKPGWPLKVVNSIEPRRMKRESEKRQIEVLRHIFEARTHSESVDRAKSLFQALEKSCRRTPTVS